MALLRVVLTVASFGILHVSFMFSKDAIGFFTSLLIFLALSSLDFYDRVGIHNRKFDKFAGGLYLSLCIPAFFGMIMAILSKVLSDRIVLVEGNYTYLVIPNFMELPDVKILFTHIFYFFYLILLVFSVMTLISPKKKEKEDVRQEKEAV